MTNDTKHFANTGMPEVVQARSILEIVENFTDPKEVFREAISNALDWGATNIRIKVFEDARRNNELVIDLWDNGQGLNEARFKAFWNLADSPGLAFDDVGRKKGGRTGEKGHGTKTYWKCREIELESISTSNDGRGWHVVALMREPIVTLRQQDKKPPYEYDNQYIDHQPTYTHVTIRGYHAQSRENFRHDVLKDYILWFTKIGSIELELGKSANEGKTIELQGLGQPMPESLIFGHRFPEISDNVRGLRARYQEDWPNYYVKRWVFSDQPIPGYPSSTFDMVFYIEGDAAKRAHNLMLSRKGRRKENWHYTATDRYGLYLCKDWIPLPPSQRVSDWISKKTEWTLYHSFVNCQDFRLTANRASVGNTEHDFLEKLRSAVVDLFESEVKASAPYRAYREQIKETENQEKGEATAKEEKDDVDERYARASRKHIASYAPSEIPAVTLLEPREEIEVLILFSQIAAVAPHIFDFHIVDYSAYKGIDALCTVDIPLAGLQKGNLRYVEFKKALQREIGHHTFRNLTAIVCWECNLPPHTKIKDLLEEERELRITERSGQPTIYMVVAPETAPAANIPVYVLKDYLPHKLNIQFKARAT